jgi:SNF2 family DNA or RNA helicase
MMNYKLSPFKHQLSGTALLMENKVFGLFDDMGTGKSKTLIDAACALRQQGKIDAVVLVCPNTVKSNWTDPEEGEIVLNGWDDIEHGVYQISAGKKLWPLDRLGKHDLQWIVVNYDVVWRNKTEKWLREFMQKYNALMALDESQFIKTPSSNRTRGCWRLGGHAVRRVIMSGTPITKDIRDAYAQYRFLDWSILGYPNFSTFKADVIVYDNEGPTVGGKLVKIKEFKNVDKITAKIAPYYRRVEKKDCLDLPEKVFERRHIPLSKELETMYIQMKDKLIAEFRGIQVKAPIALTKILKLQQISSGFINYVDEEGNRATETFNSPKVKEASQLVRDHEGSAIIFYQMNAEREMLEAALTEHEIPYYAMYGEVKQEDRRALTQGFKAYERPVMLCQQRTGGIGINMTAADLVIFISNDAGWDLRAQAEDRAHRSGQTKSVTYIDLLSTVKGRPSIDHWILKLVKQKKDAAGEIIMTQEDMVKFLESL